MSGWQQGQVSKSPLPVESHRTHLTPPAVSLWQPIQMVSTRGAYETQCPGDVLGAGHVGAPCLACEHFQTPRKQVFSTNHTVQSLGTVSHSDLEMAETPPKSKFPDASQDQADLRITASKLHPWVLLLFSLFYKRSKRREKKWSDTCPSPQC